jgi:biotin synthase
VLDVEDIVDALHVRGDEQDALFARAAHARHAHWGDRVVVRGVTEITNLCRVDCEFCPMRRANSRVNQVFKLGPDQLVEAARAVRDSGINVVFFQGGEIPQTTRIVGEAIPRIRELFDDTVEILLNLGNKSRDEYKYLRDQGADSYILKFESSDPQLHERMRHETLDSRLRCLQDLLDLGFKVGTGSIVGLPGQSPRHLAEDIAFARDLGVHMCSVSPFIPAPATPMADCPAGDLELTLNAIAVMRLVEPSWLIPSVSALAKSANGGQHRGFRAGANVLTINFTAEQISDSYLIYGKDRFVVRNDYARRLIDEVGLAPSGSVFIAETPSRVQHGPGAR